MTHHMVFCCVNHRHQCHFGPEDKSDVVPDDMQALLRSTKKRRKKNARSKEKKNVILEYDAFPVNKATAAKVKRISRIVVGCSIKKGCQRCFVEEKTLS
jgi:hypothetical protein